MAEEYTKEETELAIHESNRQSSLRDSDKLEDIVEAIELLNRNDKECALAIVDFNVKDTLDEQKQFVLKCYLRKINHNLTERAYLVSRMVQLTKPLSE